MHVKLSLERDLEGRLVTLDKIAGTMALWVSSFAELAMAITRETFDDRWHEASVALAKAAEALRPIRK